MKVMLRSILISFNLACFIGGLLVTSCELTGFNDLVITVLALGMSGGALHSLISISHHTGNKTLSYEWGWFYMLRPFIGAGLGYCVYLIITAGLLNDNIGEEQLNQKSIKAIVFATGLFSKHALEFAERTLKSIFNLDDKESKNTEPDNGQVAGDIGNE